MSLQAVIDGLCANFTQRSMFMLLQGMLAERPRTMGDLAVAIAERDRTLDIGSAKSLAEAAVEALAESGVIAIEDPYVYPADGVPR